MCAIKMTFFQIPLQTLGELYFFKWTLLFSAVLDAQQHWGKSTEISRILPALTRAQPPRYQPGHLLEQPVSWRWCVLAARPLHHGCAAHHHNEHFPGASAGPRIFPSPQQHNTRASSSPAQRVSENTHQCEVH